MEAKLTKTVNSFPGRGFCTALGVLAWMISTSGALAQQIPIVEHLPIPAAQENSPVKVETRVSAPGRSVVYARLYFKALSQQSFRYLDMRPTATGYAASIPASVVKPPITQYFILILFSDQAVFTYPERNPYGQPFEIIVTEIKRDQQAPRPSIDPALGGQQNTVPPTQPGETQPVTPQILEKLQRLETQPTMAQQPDTTLPQPAEALAVEDESPILILSPEPFSSIAASEIVIAASFITETPIDSSSIRVSLDNEDITEDGEVSPVLVSISPQSDMSPGEHKVVITARDLNGNTLAPLSWRFSVVGEQDVEITTKRRFATGVVFAESRQEKFSGIKLSNNNLGANFTGGYGMIGYSGQLYITSLENAAFQPRNRFAFTAGGKLLTVSLGDMNPRFDELILWGQRVRGFGASLHLGSIFNIDFVTGTTNRTVAAQYASIAGIPVLTRSGTFERRLMGIRPSFGGGQNFQWGLTLLKVRDQVNSLKPGESSVTPKDNLVVGSDVLIAFDSHRFELKGSAALSLTSNDITNGASSKDSIKAKFDIDPPFDPKSFEKYFIINESTFPLDPTKGNSLAYIVTLRMNYFNNYLQLGFKRLGDSYSSLGNSFLRNDVKGFFVNDRLRLFRNRVYLNLGLERYNEHFSQSTTTPKIDLNTFSYGLSVFWGQNLPSLNFNVRNYRRDNNIDTLPTAATVDTREDALTRDFNFSINYDAALFNLNHTVTLNLTSSNRDDSFASQRPAGVPPGNLNSNVQLISVRTKYDFPLTSTLTYARNSSNIANGANTLKYNLISGRGEYSMLQDKLKAYGGLRFVSASGAAAPSIIGPVITQSLVDYKQTAFQLGGSYQLAPAHMFTLDFDIIKFSNNGGTRTTNTLNLVTFVGNPSYNDSMIRAYYEFRF